jgi:nickel-dependent lactate racemase
MSIVAEAVAAPGSALDSETLRLTLESGLGRQWRRRRVLVLIPDHTRTLPLAQLFPLLTSVLADARKLDVMVALGTHPALSESALHALVGISPVQHRAEYRNVGLVNHHWDDPAALASIGTLTGEEMREIAGAAWHPSLGGDVPIRINRAALDCDDIVIVGPTFPHEVVGFSGGAKYIFPGICGPEIINTTHWLGALLTILNTIGIRDTPVRTVIHAAAERLPVPVTLVSLVVQHGEVAGIFVGDHVSAWEAAADLSAALHIIWADRPYQRVLSCAPPMYDELWTAAKAMYKLEPVVADGGEIVVYAPELRVLSHTHGPRIHEAGYHVRDYYLKQWNRFGHIPLGVLAHGTHLRGSGTYDHGVEKARIRVTLASQIPESVCSRLGLGYADPNHINPSDWQGREDEGILFVPKAGEILYRLA